MGEPFNLTFVEHSWEWVTQLEFQGGKRFRTLEDMVEAWYDIRAQIDWPNNLNWEVNRIHFCTAQVGMKGFLLLATKDRQHVVDEYTLPVQRVFVIGDRTEKPAPVTIPTPHPGSRVRTRHGRLG
jgi:hypothetical protein